MSQAVRPKHTRVYMACTACRARKSKCVSDQHENKPCERCVRKNLRCEYVPVPDSQEEYAASSDPALSLRGDEFDGAPPAHVYGSGPRSGNQGFAYAASPLYRPLTSRFGTAPLNANPGFGRSFPPIATPQPQRAPGSTGTYYAPPDGYNPGPAPAQYNPPAPPHQQPSLLPSYQPRYDYRLMTLPQPPIRQLNCVCPPGPCYCRGR
ncbi:hypothetical protein C8F04DRAFT_1147009 [Mycena alexandri]|uniref:Zn(2)-C6 fungal-type domain-containing protein n=1 Tax=Mycena alexandri TaxID=1745969 RepID=A0AAD6WMC5_9AGAR|nr:hypothetical protein C8F04DRAFT_1161011 [Mycena alexandri]KAJ7017051.1 hypothetical protein C8F04DRAFT_1158276 [Mycena alexandri]KAJ7019628.1 hypothetical protein C8F04DRAFT_1147009 [Mycena alexandri]